MHSQGEWKVVGDGVRNEGGYICFLPKPHHYTGQDERYAEELQEWKDNGFLIASAPELLTEHKRWAKDFAVAWVRILQGDLNPAIELARSMKIDFEDGEPVLRSEAVAKAEGR